MQIWEKDGCGADRSTIRKILSEFKENGVSGLKSASALTNYLDRLNGSAILDMYSIDDETTLQMLVDYLGAKEAFRRCCAATCIHSDKWKQEAAKRQEKIEEMQEKIRLKDLEILTLKAKLYDTYEAHNIPTDNY